MGLIFNGNGDVIKAVDGSLTVEGLDIGGSTNINAGIGTFSGNLNVGGVLTYEDVKNVDSVGIVTARDHINIVTDNKKLQIGAGQDLTAYHDGTDSWINSTTGDLKIRSQGDDLLCYATDDIYLMPQGNDNGVWIKGGGGVTLYHNNLQILETTSTGVKVQSTGNTELGVWAGEAGNAELHLYADENDDDIDHWKVSANGNDSKLNIQYYTGSWENAISVTPNGGVILYRNNESKLNTHQNGIEVFGPAAGSAAIYLKGKEGQNSIITLITDDNDDDPDAWQIKAQNSDNSFRIQNKGGGSYEDNIVANHSGNVELYFNNSKKLETTNTGVKIDNASTTEMIMLDVSGTNFAKIGHNSASGVAVLDVRSEGHTRFLTNGNNERLRITSTGLMGLGTGSPSDALEISHASDPAIRLHYGGNSGYSVISMDNANNLTLDVDVPSAGSNSFFNVKIDGSEKFRIASNGNVHIGSGNPTIAKLQVSGAGFFGSANTTKTNDGVIIERNSSDGIAHITAGRSGGNYSGFNYYVAGASGVTLRHQIDYQSNFKWFAADGTTERLRIDSSGNVMMGRTSASKKFSVRETSTSSGVYYNAQIGGANHLANYAVGIAFDPEGYAARTKMALVAEGTSQGYSRGKFHFLLDAANDSGEATLSESRMTITDAGNIGINKTAPAASLHIGGPSEIRLDNASDAGNWARIRCFEESGNNHAILAFNVGSGEALRIANDGKVGINETSPDRALHVTTTTDTEQIYVENTASSGRAQVRFVNPHGDWVTGLIGGTTEGDFITYTSAAKNFRVYTNTLERLRITSAGNVGINDNNPDNQLVVKSVSGHTTAKVTSGDETTSMVMQAIQGSEGRLGMNTNHPLAIYAGGLEKLRITSGGEIQQYGFTGSADGSADDLALGNTTDGVNRGMTIWSHTSQNGNIAFADNDSNWRGAIQYLHADDVMRLIVAGGEKILIKSNGDVGIGENSPTRRLHVASDDDLTAFTGGNYGTFAIENSQWDNGDYTACLLYTSPSPRDRQKSRMPSSA